MDVIEENAPIYPSKYPSSLTSFGEVWIELERIILQHLVHCEPG